MRSVLLGIGLYFFGALVGTLIWYIDRPYVFLTFVLPQLPFIALAAALAIAVMQPAHWLARAALAVLLILPLAWIASSILGLIERLPAGPAWTIPAVFRIAFLTWLGAEFWIGIVTVLRSRREDIAPVQDPRLWPAILGAPPALFEITDGKRGTIALFGAAAFFFAFAVLQALALVVSPDVTWQIAIAKCGPANELTRTCFLANSTGELFGQFIVWPIGFFGSIWIARKFEAMAQKRTRQSAAEAMARNNTDAPILFLRAFKNDQVRLKKARTSPMRWLIGRIKPEHYLDHMLVEEFATYGPTVALGRPGQDVPPFGVWRSYFHDATDVQWQAEVERLAVAARVIVMVADDGKGVAWELEHLGKAGHLCKTIFVAPPEFFEAGSNMRLWDAINAQSGFNVFASKDRPSRPVLAALPGPEGGSCVATSERFTANEYLAALRWMFREIADRQAAVPTSAT